MSKFVFNPFTGKFDITSSDATTTAKGEIQLAGVLAGTAAVPAIASSINLPGSPTTTTQSPSDNSTKIATTAYADAAVAAGVIGLLDYRGTYNASTNLFPSAGGSGAAGAVLKGDFWVCSVAGILGGTAVTSGDLIIALTDAPAQFAVNWDLVEHDGTFITGLTGDVLATGPGNVPATLATVNSNVGTFGSANQVPQVTVNGKGLITAVTNVTIVAPVQRTFAYWAG